MGESSVTLVAMWTAKTATVTLDAVDGAIDGQRYYTFEVTFGQIYGIMPSPE